MLALALATMAATTNVGVAEREWRIAAYRTSVARGRVAFNVHNYGEDPHDLRVLGPGGYRSAVTGEIRSGAGATLVVTLRRPGTYRLICTLTGHAAKGMRVTLRVR
jgi:plastocyanin